MGTQESRTSDATSNPSPFSYNPPGKWDYRLSVVVIGAAVHQPIVSRFINTFQAPDESSVFSDWRHHTIPRCCTVLLDDKRVRLELYDDGGSSSSHGALQSDSVKDRDGVIVVYDYTFTGSFELAKKIIREAVALHEVTQMKSQVSSVLRLLHVHVHVCITTLCLRVHVHTYAHTRAQIGRAHV